MYTFFKKYRAFKADESNIKYEYLRQKSTCYYDNVYFYNWWQIDNYKSLWFYRFLKNTGLLNNSERRINFCSLFGNRDVLNYVYDGVKIFFSGENLHSSHWSNYSDALLGDKECKLSLGFDYFDHERYFRFPLWLTYVFEPTIDENIIRQRCEQLRFPQIGSCEKFASLIARADISGVRSEMYNELSKIDKVFCPSELFHNDDSLVHEFKDNKIEYLRNFLFNICPENSNAYGYCTEKIFEAIMAGCIPIYWGSYNMPEPTILNPESIIFWDKKNNGIDTIRIVKELYTNPNALETFLKQPRLLPNAENEVLRMIQELYIRLKVLIEY